MQPAARRCAGEDDAGWAAGFHDAAGWRELAGRLIDPEGDDVVALEVCGVERPTPLSRSHTARRGLLPRRAVSSSDPQQTWSELGSQNTAPDDATFCLNCSAGSPR